MILIGYISYFIGMVVFLNGLYLVMVVWVDIKLWELSMGYLIWIFIDFGFYIDFYFNGKLISIGKDGVRLIDIEMG